jgi:hypothetical protein
VPGVLRSYDLLLQAKTPGEPLAREQAVAALAAAGATLDAEGRGAWRLPKGMVEVAPLLEGGALLGLEVKVPLSDRTELLEATVKALAEIVEHGPLRLVDPQRATEASVGSLGSMTDEFFRLARHAGEFSGVSEAVSLTSYAQPPETFSTTARVLGALLAFLVALYATWRIVTSLLEGEAEAPVDPPAKVLGK